MQWVTVMGLHTTKTNSPTWKDQGRTFLLKVLEMRASMAILNEGIWRSSGRTASTPKTREYGAILGSVRA